MRIQKLSTLSLNNNLARYIILSYINFSLLILKALLQYMIYPLGSWALEPVCLFQILAFITSVIWASLSAPLYLRFLTCKMKVMIAPIS